MNNRQFKFRVWDKINKKWLKNCSIDCHSGVTISPLKDSGIEFNSILVRTQFTGLTDKNGKEIYEGDLIRFDKRSYASDNMNFVIKFGQYNCPFGEGYETDKEYGFFAETVVLPYYIDSIALSNKIQVVGNMFETPELLNF